MADAGNSNTSEIRFVECIIGNSKQNGATCYGKNVMFDRLSLRGGEQRYAERI